MGGKIGFLSRIIWDGSGGALSYDVLFLYFWSFSFTFLCRVREGQKSIDGFDLGQNEAIVI